MTPSPVGEQPSGQAGSDVATGGSHNWENGVDMESFESLVTDLDDGDALADRRAVVGNMGTLSERLGPEEAEQFVRENSLTYYTRIRAAQRLGGISTSRL